MVERGTIASLKPEKGYGFIARDNGGGDVFFHASQVIGGDKFAMLEVGQAVEFDPQPSERGERASKVRSV